MPPASRSLYSLFFTLYNLDYLLQGFLVFHSFGGGTGMTEYFLWDLMTFCGVQQHKNLILWLVPSDSKFSFGAILQQNIHL